MEVCKALVESLLVGADLNCIVHQSCVKKSSARARKAREREELASLTERKAEVVGQDQGRLKRATRIGSWLIAVPHHLNVTEISWEEF